MRQKFQFQISPNSPEQFDLTKGVVFEQGVIDGLSINKFTVYPLVMHLDGTDSTDNARSALERLLRWGAEEFSLNYSDDSIARWAYVSDVVFDSDIPLLERLNPTLTSISARIRQVVRGNLKEDLDYRPAKVWLSHDPGKRSTALAPFTLEHRALSEDEDNKFFSEAPLPTNEHIALLSELENSLRG